MTKNNIIIKNLKYNLKNHISLILSYIIIAFIIYQLGIVLCNADYDITGIKPMVAVLYCVLLLFSFVFINYVIVAYNKSRSKEFGIYLSLGLEKNDIYKFIFIENTVLMIVASFIGISISMIITEILNRILVDIEYFNKISLHFNVTNLFITIIVLLLLYVFTNVRSISKIRKSNITYIIKDEDIGNKSKGKFGSLIIGCILFSCIYIIGILDSIDVIDFSMIMLVKFFLYFISVYLIISNLSYFFNYKAKKNLKYYYNNILHLMDINYMFGQYKKVLYLTSITVFMGLLISSSMAGSFYSNIKISERMNPNELQIIQSTDEEFDYKNLGLDIKPKCEFEGLVYDGYFFVDNNTIDDSIRLDTHLNEEEIIIYGDSVKSIGDKKVISLENGDNMNLLVKDINSDVILINGSDIVYGVSEKIFSQLKNTLQEYSIVTFENDTDLESKEKILRGYISKNKLNVKVKSANAGSKNAIKDQISYSFLIFILTITFFVASGAILYFKIFIDIDRDKKKFMKLRLLGVEKKDIIRTIKKEISLIFSITYIFGGLSAYIWMIIHFASSKYLLISMLGLTILFIIFTISMRVFYRVTTRRLIKING
ncbi:ABC transporter permease protein YxdM [Vallitalea longa]|uniref:ABC transporter permease protein YxdM n=1 Tax=Vallitalea longa TaxID=2936439 RepID=A0A9W6DGG5_9FIRM|nr:ABC transporter permease [Vallitalea longa]GKX29719.1 ABC transporter permease protein YxdM [Vallitalea longa]